MKSDAGLFTELINEHYKQLNESDIHNLKIIIEYLYRIETINIEELGRKCNTSKSSILRLTQKLGFSGYSEFKNYLKWQKHRDVQLPRDFPEDIRKDLLDTFSQLESSNQLDLAASLINNSKNVFIYGTGQAQRQCALELQRLFMEINKYIYYIGASDEFSMVAKGLGKGDVIIIISLSGELKKIEDAVHFLKLKKASVISITNLSNNQLAGLADCRLYAVSSPLTITEELMHNSFISFYIVIEYLFRQYLLISSDGAATSPEGLTEQPRQ